MDPREVREERIGLGGAASILGRSASTVRRYVAEGRLHAERTGRGGYSLLLSEVEELARLLGSQQGSQQGFDSANDADATAEDEEIFEGEVIGEEAPYGASSRLPAVPFERYERLLQQGQDYKTRLEERTKQIEEVRKERDAARMEIDRLWSEIERLNLIEFQRELQEKTISTLEEEKAKLEAERERLSQEKMGLVEEKSTLYEERVRLEAELNALKNRRGFWARLFGG
jgi:DNA repair exonuclease SbcCD ATPase subunit